MNASYQILYLHYDLTNSFLIKDFPNVMNNISIFIVSQNETSVKDIVNTFNDELFRLSSHFKYKKLF